MTPDETEILCALNRLTARHGSCRFDLSFQLAAILIAHIQLALRHPDNRSQAADEARQFVEAWIDRIGAYEARLAEILRCGFDPAYDVLPGAALPQQPRDPALGDRRIEQARDLLLAALRDHERQCTRTPCLEIGGMLGYLAHCLGAGPADLLAMNRALLDYDLHCPGGADHIHRPPPSEPT